MKPPASQASPRRLASPKKQVKLDLQRRPKPAPENEPDTEPKSSFWKWVIVVAVFHVLLFIFVFIFHTPQTPPPPEPKFISLVPPGEIVQGKAGPQEGAKVAPTPTEPAKVKPPSKPIKPKHETPKPTPPPVTPPPEAIEPPPLEPTPVEPPKVEPIEPPKPVVKTEAPKPTPIKPAPVKPAAVKPAPAKPKVKVDHTLVDGPAVATDKPVTKPKPKKPVKTTVAPTEETSSDEPSEAPAKPGLTKAEIAKKLGQNLEKAGVEKEVKVGTSGSNLSQANPYAEFYRSVRDQVMSKWEHPNLNDETAVNPEVTIYVEKDGHVPPEKVVLSRSSGNQVYDDSAVAAAKSLGTLLEPLPDGCDPVIHINFKLTR